VARFQCTLADLGALTPVAVWTERSVFLTGHTGFKGSWLALWLERLGARVTGFSLPASSPSLYEATGLHGRFRETLGDIRDLSLLVAALRDANPEVVFHLAGQPLVRASHIDPLGTFGTNIMGTVNLLEAVRHCETVRAVVVVTTDKVYRNRDNSVPFRETDPLGGDDPYSASKVCVEHLCATYRASYFNTQGAPLLATARAGNAIGGGDWAEDRLIPDLMRAFGSRRVASIRAPQSLRPWQHVLEPLKGYLMLAERLFEGQADFARAWNFAPWPAPGCTVEVIASRVAAFWGAAARFEIDPGIRLSETLRLQLDPAMAAALLGWTPRLALEDALRMTVDWYRASERGDDLCALTLAQIGAYERSCF
jgi:CDP-glucose 4,6-dehydratase